MNDLYLLLTPLLMLPIVALLGFVGCDKLLGLEHIPDPLPPPTNLTATAGDKRVDLSWDAYAHATKYHVKRGETSGDYSATHDVDPSQTTFADTQDVVNNTSYYYVVSAMVDTRESENSAEAMAIPMNPNEEFVTSFVPGLAATSFSGWAGMEFTVSTNSLTVHALGRVHAPGNNQKHTIKIVEKATLTDVASVLLDMAGGTDGAMQSAPLASAVTLNMNTTYYIVSQEVSGTDQLYMDDTTIQTTSAATVAHAISGDGVTYLPGSTGNHCFGPLSFQYMLI